jgi:hypothetical protein
MGLRRTVIVEQATTRARALAGDGDQHQHGDLIVNLDLDACISMRVPGLSVRLCSIYASLHLECKGARRCNMFLETRDVLN